MKISGIPYLKSCLFLVAASEYPKDFSNLINYEFEVQAYYWPKEFLEVNK